MENQGNRKCPWEKMTGSSRRREKIDMEATNKNAEAVNSIIDLLTSYSYTVKEANEILNEVSKRISSTSKVNNFEKITFQSIQPNI